MSASSAATDPTVAGTRRYRSKAQRPCDLCRARKALCNIPDPLQPCQLCKRIGRECTFVGNPARHARYDKYVYQPNNSSTKYADYSADNPAENQHAVSEFIWPSNSPLNWDLGNDPLAQNLEFRDSPAAFLQTQGRNGTLGDEGALQPSTHVAVKSPDMECVHERSSLDERPNHSTTFIGHSNESDPFLVNHFPHNDRDEIDFFRVTYRQITGDKSQPLHFLQSQAGTAAESRRVLDECLPKIDERERLENIVDKDTGASLVRLYFRFVFQALPILSRSLILPEVERFVAEASTGLLAGIYMLSLPFTPWDETLCMNNAYTKPSVDGLWQISYICLQRELHFPRLSTVQIFLLLLNQVSFDSVSVENPSAWSMAASLLGMAQSLGLNADPRGWNLPPWEIRLRRRLWWSAYVEHTWRSVTHGRSSMIRHDDWDVSPLTVDDFATDPATPALLGGSQSPDYIIQLCSLTRIADEICRLFFTLRAISQRPTLETLMSQARGPRQQLLDWLDQLPESLQLHPETEPSAEHSIESHAPLYVTYYTAHILIFRALLRPIISTDINPSLLPASSTSILQASRSLVQTITKFICGLDVRHQSAFWPAYTRHCLSYPGLFCYMLSLQQSEPHMLSFDRALLDTWRKALRTRVQSWAFLRFAIVKVDAIYWKGLREPVS
ncbi:fungal specific transcription factor domain-containing protein [Colletotrichum kahawae]|uniref:Fungal specific transcription factor domain-containing protein n=1 Tax=Colletotrichum kahawae TaxID=34407 RepID=A0AAD9Y7V3_COLKA|nr:fungal specific transcription factor domain-containing protein [Colletotrichum kahawae]